MQLHDAIMSGHHGIEEGWGEEVGAPSTTPYVLGRLEGSPCAMQDCSPCASYPLRAPRSVALPVRTVGHAGRAECDPHAPCTLPQRNAIADSQMLSTRAKSNSTLAPDVWLVVSCRVR